MFIGIDIGTQSLKAIVADAGFAVLGRGSSSYHASYPRPGWAEQDSGLWLRALGPAIAQALASAEIGPADVQALAVCGQLDGCLGLGQGGEPVRPAIIWSDRRATAEVEDVDPVLVRDRTGLVLDATHMAAKIRWCQRQLKTGTTVEVWHQPTSFVVEILTGERMMDHSLASTTMLYDLFAGRWDEGLLMAFEIDRARLPSIAAAGARAGTLSTRGAELTGLPSGIPVAVGTGDDFSNPLGCGIVEPGTVAVTLGIGEAISAISATPVIDAEGLVETHAYPAACFHLGNPGWMSGGAVSWFLTTFGVADAEGFSALAAAAPLGCDGLLFLPALSGAMAPRWVAAARGAFYGVSASHTKAHFARAVLEGTSFAMRDVIDRFAALGIEAPRIRLVGGGAASPVWTQIRSDVLQQPVAVLRHADASAMGAVILAAVAAGEAPSVAGASASLRLPLAETEPAPGRQAVYEDAYRRYRRLFEALTPMFV